MAAANKGVTVENIGITAEKVYADLECRTTERSRIRSRQSSRLSSIAFGNQTISGMHSRLTVLRPCLATGLPLSEQSTEKELGPPQGGSEGITTNCSLFVKI